jgi:hypothetical protein
VRRLFSHLLVAAVAGMIVWLIATGREKPTRTEPDWSAPITIRKGTEAPVTLLPHGIVRFDADGQPERNKRLRDIPADAVVWSVWIDGASVQVACTEQPTSSPHTVS